MPELPRPPAPPPPPERLRLAAIQMKFASCIAENAARIREFVRAAARRRADAVLFPECALTGYSYDFTRLDPAELHEGLAAVSEAAARHKTNVLLGTPIFCGGRLYNCLVVFDRQGKAIHCYAKCQLTESDRAFFAPGNAVSLFPLDGVTATAVICHERRYPELVRLAVMAGAQILFHPNAGLDALAVSRTKRGGRDGIPARAFENAIYYVFANSVGPQGGGAWSAGDSKIVAPDERVLQLADNEQETVLVATAELSKATRVYARRSLEQPQFLSRHWHALVGAVREQAAAAALHRQAESLAGLAGDAAAGVQPP